MAKAVIEKGPVDRTGEIPKGIARPTASGVVTKPRPQFHLEQNATKKKGMTVHK